MITQENTTPITRIYNLIILDESGSMSSIYDQALGGANETIQTIRSAQESSSDQKHFFTFVTFGSSIGESVRTIIDAKPIKEVRDLTGDDYRPNGCTPLYDAMGKALTALEQKTSEGDQVLVTIITDGMENSSREFTSVQVCDIVKRLRAKGWTFVYIGANQDAVEVAKQIYIDNAMNFSATHEDTRRMWNDYKESATGYYEKVRCSKLRGERVFEDTDFFMQKQRSTRVTPENITHLASGEIFVFGSDISGFHNGGAAGYACRHFGAVYGNPAGPQGQCYAIPITGISPFDFSRYVQDFIDYAEAHPHLKFLVTAIGCGNGGYDPRDIAPLFDRAKYVSNIWLPSCFWMYI